MKSTISRALFGVCALAAGCAARGDVRDAYGVDEFLGGSPYHSGQIVSIKGCYLWSDSGVSAVMEACPPVGETNYLPLGKSSIDVEYAGDKSGYSRRIVVVSGKLVLYRSSATEMVDNPWGISRIGFIEAARIDVESR